MASLPAKFVERVLKLYYEDRAEVRKICALTKRSSRTVYEVINSSGKGKRDRFKLDAAKIAELYDKGILVKQIAFAAGCSENSVCRIAQEKRLRMRGRGPSNPEIRLAYDF